MAEQIKLTALNEGSQEDFVRGVGPVFEHSTWIAERTWNKRPFGTVDDLREELCATVRASTKEEQLALIRAHPDLVGRAALAGTLTQASTSEQAGAGLHRLTPEEIATFQKYNSEYREKFGFPFVICARLNKKAAILEAFPRRLKNSMQEEMRAALEEIYKIAYFRLQDIFTQQ